MKKEVIDILNYLTNRSSYLEDLSMQEWINESDENKADIEKYRLLLNETSLLKNYNHQDVESEWSLFEQLIEAKKPLEVEKISTPIIKESKIIDIGRPISNSREIQEELIHESKPVAKESKIAWPLMVAASLILLISTHFIFNQPEPPYGTLVTTDNLDSIQMIDGTTIILDKNSTLKYPLSIKGKSRREVVLAGVARFEVAKNKELPFRVVSKHAGIDVLGTIFTVEIKDSTTEVENIEGSIRMFDITNEDYFIDLSVGEKFSFDGKEFKDLTPTPEVIINQGEVYKIYDIFAYLQNKFDGKLYISPFLSIDTNAKARVNLDQSLQDILIQLDSTANIEYVKKKCNSCFELRKFLGKKK